MKLKGNSKILLIPLNGIGDNIMYLPLAYNLKRQLPETTIHVLSNSSNHAARIMRFCPYIDKIITFKFRGAIYTVKEYLIFFLCRFFPLIIKLKKENYDFIFTHNPNLLIRAILLFYSKRKIVVNTNFEINQYENILSLLNPFDNLNEERNYTELLFMDDGESVLNKFNLQSDKYIAINFSGYSASRNWTEPNTFLDKLNSLLNGKLKIVLIGTNTNKAQHYNKAYTNLINKTTIEEAALIIKRAVLFITVDSGLMHISCALNSPTIALFGSVNSEFLSPINTLKYFSTYDGRDEKSAYEKRSEALSNKNYIDNIDKELILKETEQYLIHHNYI